MSPAIRSRIPDRARRGANDPGVRRQLRREHRAKVDDPLTPGQAVSEFPGRTQSGRTRCQDTEVREFIGCDFEYFARILGLMYFVQNYGIPGDLLKNRLRIFQELAVAREIAVEEGRILPVLRQRRFANTPNTRKPDDGGSSPRLLDFLNPKGPFNHTASVYK